MYTRQDARTGIFTSLFCLQLTTCCFPFSCFSLYLALLALPHPTSALIHQPTCWLNWCTYPHLNPSQPSPRSFLQSFASIGLDYLGGSSGKKRQPWLFSWQLRFILHFVCKPQNNLMPWNSSPRCVIIKKLPSVGGLPTTVLCLLEKGEGKSFLSNMF